MLNQRAPEPSRGVGGGRTPGSRLPQGIKAERACQAVFLSCELGQPA